MTTAPQVDTDLRDKQYGTPSNLSARFDLHRRFSTNSEGWLSWLWDQMALKPGERLLEIGCGEGSLWAKNASRLADGLQLRLTDFSPGMLSATETRLSPLLPGATFAVVNAESIPYPAASFDIVIANHMLYHVPDQDRALAEMRRVLRSDGRFVAATNGDRHMHELDDLVNGVVPGLDMFSMDRPFRLENGDAILRRHFAQVERHDYVDSLDVTDPVALIAYVRSSSSTINPDAYATMRTASEETIAAHGAFHIEKAAGLFIGSGVPIGD